MAFKAFLKLDGQEFRLLHCSYSLGQNTDYTTGKPTSDVMGGQVNAEFESTKESKAFELMIDPHKKFSGGITFFKQDEDAPMKEIKFEDAFLTGYSESMDARTNTPMSTSVVISARKLSVGGASHENKWAK
ncbi:type VI secretion system tube protein TssD [Fibrella arboris]|uniref:type VI secretion system tube protein TssD n=1 Tax=Fibrella arboris TaxID=3242486 RepID=UPI00351FF348